MKNLLFKILFHNESQTVVKETARPHNQYLVKGERLVHQYLDKLINEQTQVMSQLIAKSNNLSLRQRKVDLSQRIDHVNCTWSNFKQLVERRGSDMNLTVYYDAFVNELEKADYITWQTPEMQLA